MFDEDELLPISALQHFVFCPRRCALVHIEQVWSENRFTVEGDILHQRVDELGRESRLSLIVSHGVGIRSLRFGVTGIVDVIEFRSSMDGCGACALPGKEGHWIPYPIEYKRGSLRRGFGDDIQICAQALCVEEMLDCSVPAGAIYYASTRKRREIAFDAKLREQNLECDCRCPVLDRGRRYPFAGIRKEMRHLLLVRPMSAQAVSTRDGPGPLRESLSPRDLIHAGIAQHAVHHDPGRISY